MKKAQLQTPAILVDLDILDYNIKRIQSLCNLNGKQLWPMIKTHKSTEIVKMQEATGSTGFLCGTLDECEAICKLGIKNIMYAYPVAGDVSIQRAIKLARKCNFIVRIDNYDGAKMLNTAAKSVGIKVNYTIIIDCGLHRFGLDQGAHGNTSLKGYGYVKGYPEITVYSLSEEVAKFHIEGSTTLKVGDKVEIIPNHACSTANLTSFLIGCRGDTAEKLIPIDIRENSTTKNFNYL